MHARQALGQHFLTKKTIASTIVREARIGDGMEVLEIGPGKGILTDVLLAEGASVVAVEKDPALAETLADRFAVAIQEGRLTTVTGDILAYDISELPLSCGDFAVVANIPYAITGRILRTMLSGPCLPHRAVLLVQHEVAERITAADGKESLLSISVKAYGTPRYVKKVPASAFAPPPQVDSAIIAIEDIASPFTGNSEADAFFSLLHAGFAEKRKQIGKKLVAAYGPRASAALEACGIAVHNRAEELGVNDWKCLTKKISSNNETPVYPAG